MANDLNNEEVQGALGNVVAALDSWMACERELDNREIEIFPEDVRALSDVSEVEAVAPAVVKEQPEAEPEVVRKPIYKQPPPPKVEEKPAPKTIKLGHVHDVALLAEMVDACRRCPLHQWRNKAVPGTGNAHQPDIMFVGEGPGSVEDQQGIPFVGPAGKLLDRMMGRMGYSRDDIFIANIVKCRASVDNAGRRDRPPTDEEMAGCIAFLQRQIDLIQPKVIVCLGNSALKGLFGVSGIVRRRGKWLEYKGIPVMPTYHPAYLLRQNDSKEGYFEVWEDLKAVLGKLGRPVPEKKG